MVDILEQAISMMTMHIIIVIMTIMGIMTIIIIISQFNPTLKILTIKFLWKKILIIIFQRDISLTIFSLLG